MRKTSRWQVSWALIIAVAAFPVALQAQTPEEGEMRYAEKPIEHEFLVQIDLDTGEAQLTAESALRLKRLRETGTIDFVRSIDVELHPAPVEAGILGSHGISPENRVRKTSEALESVLKLPVGLHFITPGKSSETITIPNDPSFRASTSVSRVSLGWLSQPTLARILYVTDRAATEDMPGHLTYGMAENDRLAFGWATVQIDRHLSRPAEGQWAWVTRWFKNDPKPPSAARLTSVPIDGMKQLANVLSDNLKRAKQDEVLIYVHGFNTTYDQVVEDATILGYLTKFPGPVIAYSWASRGDVADYDNDYEVASRTMPRFAQFLAAVKNVAGVKRVHVVAHSMGSRVLFWALQRSPNLRLNEVVMVAGDVAREDFKQYFTADVEKTAGRFTIYSTRTDFALYASSKVHHEPRIGYGAAPDGPFVLKGLDSVDATDVVVDILSHGYHLNSKLPQTDLLAVLHGDDVDRRGCIEWTDQTKKDLLRYSCH
jgi:esterase/lipase superfamily enzyme